MLHRFTAYTSADEESRDVAFRPALQYYDGGSVSVDGLGALCQSLLERNAQSLEPVVLSEDVQAAASSVTEEGLP